MGQKRVQKCLNDGWMTTVLIPSHTEADLEYEVIVQTPYDPEEVICECEGFQFRGYCKHQQEAIDSICGWVSGQEPGQTLEQRRSRICPRCGDETEWTTEEISA